MSKREKSEIESARDYFSGHLKANLVDTCASQLLELGEPRCELAVAKNYKRFFFARKCGPNSFASKWISSGVIEAKTLEEAHAIMDAACVKRQTTDRSVTFAWSCLEDQEAVSGGFLTLCMGG
jgi:hypothetical protein